MKIILVINDDKGKNILFVTDEFKALLLKDAINLVKQQQIPTLQLVRSPKGLYLRAKKGSDIILNSVSVSVEQTKDGLKDFLSFCKHSAMEVYRKHKIANAKPDAIWIEGLPRPSAADARVHLQKYQDIIREASKKQDIDINILGAILIDEYLRMGEDDLGDWLALLGAKTSVGIAQIKIATAQDIMRSGLYIPNNDRSLLTIPAPLLYPILDNPYHSIHLCAARVRQIINYWKKTLDISQRVDIIGTLYSLGLGKPKPIPESNERGDRIRDEWYPLAEQVFGKTAKKSL
jgi:hypothetical protein